MALIKQRLGWCGICIFSYFTSVYTIALTDFTTKPLKLPFLCSISLWILRFLARSAPPPLTDVEMAFYHYMSKMFPGSDPGARTWFSRHCRLALGRGPHPQTEWWKLNPSPKDILGPLWYQKGAFFLHVLNLRILRHDSCGLGAGRACGAFSRCSRSLESAVLQVWAVRSSHQVESCFGKLGAPLPPSLTSSAFHMKLFLAWSLMDFCHFVSIELQL